MKLSKVYKVIKLMNKNLGEKEVSKENLIFIVISTIIIIALILSIVVFAALFRNSIL